MDTPLRFCRRVTIVLALLLPGLVSSAEHDPIDAFPEAEEGMTRFVIVLPDMPRPEALYSLELVTGRVMPTDGVNQVHMDTALNARPLAGWGYTYYEMSGTGQTASTLMAPPDDAPEVDAFVHGAPLTIRYNSKLPVVVYAPEGFELRYRIWAAPDRYLSANPG